MALDSSLEGVRKALITQLHGRRIGLVPGNGSSANSSADFLGGFKAVREQVDGWNAVGTTIVSTAVTNNIPAYGLTVLGATGASATTAYNLDAPVPGVVKRLFNPTTGQVVVGTTGAGAFICSTGSVTSTLGTITMPAKGASIELYGLTTALWGVTNVSQISTGGIGVTLV